MKKIYTLFLLLVFSCVLAQNKIDQIQTSKIINSNNAILPPDPNNPTGPIVIGDPIDTVDPIFSSSEVGVTSGQLSVSLTGAATYSIPFAVPPGINGVVPQIGLSYSSQSGNGLAGYGWNISGLSSITRIPSTKFHDNNLDPVDLDSSDRFALDGQRMILKSGIYGQIGSVYETENYSNLIISLEANLTTVNSIENGISIQIPCKLIFRVKYPDGSEAIYGGLGSNSGTYTTSGISSWQNAQGVIIKYTYDSNDSLLYVTSIKYGGIGVIGTSINDIQFNYKARTRSEHFYVQNFRYTNNLILTQVKILGNNVGYRNYDLSHDTLLGYERLKSVIEKSGDNLINYNPTFFNYGDISSENINVSFDTQNLFHNSIFRDNCPRNVFGDFDGDGETDVVAGWFSNENSASSVLSEQSYVVFNTNIYDDGRPSIVNHINGLDLRQFNFGKILWDSTQNFKIDAIKSLEQSGNDYKVSNKDFLAITTLGYNVGDLSREIKIKIFKKVGSSIQLEYERKYFSNALVSDNFSGDFNGDGISDRIVIANSSNDLCFLNLDRRVNVNFLKILSTMSTPDMDSFKGKPFVADVNGDGKSDIVVFKKDSGIAVFSLNETENGLVKISETPYSFVSDPAYIPTNFGDFNGDGKSDFILPGSDRKIFISTGSGFIISNLDPNVPLITSDTQYIRQLIIADFNADNKDDILSTENDFSIDRFTLKQTYLETGSNNWKSNTFSYNNLQVGRLIMVRPSKLYEGKPCLYIRNTIREQPNSSYNYMRQGLLGFYVNQNAFNDKKLLKTIISGNGVIETITYATLIDGNGVYTKANQIENYPNYDLGSAIGFKVVSQITKFSPNVSKKQQFQYYGFAGNIEGLGSFGFRSVLKTNWFSDVSQSISNITKFDISKRGAPVENFSVLGIVSPTLTLSPADAFINRSLTTYNNENTVYENPLQPNKVFKLKSTLVRNFNGLEGTGSETTTVYNNTNAPTQITTTLKNGATVEKTSIDNYAYDVTIASPYMINRPLGITNTTTVVGDTFSSEELYSYNGNLLMQVKKKGNGTVDITEDNIYDTYGNIIKKTLSAPGLAPRIANFEYDVTTHRFLTKKIDIEGLETLYTYITSNGLLLTETLPSKPGFLLKTTLLYDNWGKIFKKTDYLGKKEMYTYANYFDGSGVIKTTRGDDGSESTLQMDNLGREIRSGVKNIDDSWAFVDTAYDYNDRIISKSQPNAGTIDVWNETKYDVYGRLTQAITLKSGSSPGKVTNYTYSGLTSTENDGQKYKVTIKNASGQVISLTETPGGTITYNYFANGNLKSSNCNGSTTTITQDGWGRKTQLVDSSAGTRNYVYSHFGELTEEEVVGQGKTKYSLNAVGKINFKTIEDASANIKSKNTYTYDPTTKLVTKLRFDDFANNTFTDNDYLFDGYKRLIKSIEKADQRASFERGILYDDFGRPLTESYLSASTADGKQSNKTVNNVYKNGYKWQILDNASGVTLWKTNTVNAQGQLLSATLGNGIAITNTYDAFGFPNQIKHEKGNANIMTLNTVFEPIYSNLTSRTNNIFGAWSETLTYDQSDRLTRYNDMVGIQNQTYNNNGTILNNNIGSHAYTISGKPYQVSSVTPVDQSPSSLVLNYYTPRTQDITYNLFKSPVTIKEQNIENIDFEYNAFNCRTAMYYGGLQTVKSLRPYVKFYAADGTMEIKRKTTSTASVEFITYIGGDAYSAPLMLKSDGTTQNLFYLHRDYQGTIVGITNSMGVVIEKRLFDVWGSLVKYANNTGVTTVPSSATGLFLDRGYTGHEHLLGVGLINMNGRIYDPKLHRFLQPDNNLQDPFNTQNYNRYAYGMNNPTKYTDPSGEFWGFVVGFLFSTYVHGAQATGDPNPLNWNAGQFLNAGLGAASPALSFAATGYANNYIESYGKPSQEQLNYINANPIYNNNIESHSHVVSMDMQNYETSNNGDVFKTQAELENFISKNIGNFNLIESALKTEITLASPSNLPEGYTLREGGRMFKDNGSEVGGTTRNQNDNGKLSKIFIPPSLKGEYYGKINGTKMAIVHELLHANHVFKGLQPFEKYTELAASTYTYTYLKAYGSANSALYYLPYVKPVPTSFSWRSLPNFINTGLK